MNVGNREPLAMKLVLEEWLHWLEDATHPFSIFPDHNNHDYLKTAKHLNPCPARCALFFAGFNFPPILLAWLQEH